MIRTFQDLRFGVRTLIRRPGFTVAAVLTLGLGVGANTAIFTLIDSVLLEPLPYESPDRLVRVLRTHPTAPYTLFSYPDLRDLRERSASLAEVAGSARAGWALTGAGDPVVLEGQRVTEGFFGIFGVGPALGRIFQNADFEPGAEKVAVLSHSLWRGRFGGEPEIIGRAIEFHDEPYTVIGVLPEEAIDYPEGPVDIWVPAPLDENDGRGSRWLQVVARLASGASLGEAQSEADLIAGQLAQAYPEPNRDRTITLEPLRDHMVAGVSTLLWVLMAAVGVVLLIACANVANLLLGRAIARGREFAIRLAIGAGRRRVVAQFLTESLTIALLGGAVGVALAFWAVDGFLALSPETVPRQGEIAVDLTVLGFSIGVGLLTGLVAGLAPALQASRPDLTESLKEGDARGGTARSGRRVRNGLAAAQIGLSTVLLIAAGLLITSFWRLTDVEPGFSAEHVATMSLNLPAGRYPDVEATLGFFDRLSERISSLPGVTDVGTGSVVPLSGQNWCHGFILEGEDDEAEECAEFRAVSPGYLRVMGIALLAGREFSRSDARDAPPVAIVDETMADRFWPGGGAIGRSVTIFDERRTIVGVVASVHDFGLDREPKPTIYLPLEQRPLRFSNVVARTFGDPKELMPAMRRQIWELDPNLPIYGSSTMDDLVSGSVAAPRFRMGLLASFAGLALILAAIGIYGVIAYDVGRRRRELGVRVALGACGTDVMRQVLGEAGRVAALGLGTGLLVAAAGTRILRGFLFRVEPFDPLVYLAVTLFLLVVALAATYVPARRASRMDPMAALRD